MSWLHPYKEHRLVIIGTRQMIVFEDTRADDKLILYDKNIEFKNGAFEAGKPNARPVGAEYEKTEQKQPARGNKS